jgi:hypothetical protein
MAQPDPVEPTRAALEAELNRYQDLLLPGAPAKLAEALSNAQSLWGARGAQLTGQVASWMERALEADAARRHTPSGRTSPVNPQPGAPGATALAAYLDPSRTSPPEAGASLLAQSIARFDLKPGAAEAMMSEIGPSLAYQGMAAQMGGIARRLESDRAFAEQYASEPPAVPASEQRLTELLRSQFSDVLDADQVPALARSLARDNLSGQPDWSIVRRVAKLLTLPAHAKYLAGGTPLPADDPRLRYSPAPAADRPESSLGRL